MEKPVAMKLIALLSVLGMGFLNGCSGFDHIETSGPLQQQVAMGSLSGSNFGGHAPVTQADVYVLQVGTNGYSSEATSLLTSVYNTQFGFATTSTNAAADGAPSGAYSVKTDNTGSFYLSNYTCTVGYPVYLAAVGGTTTSYTSFNITAYSLAGATAQGFLGLSGPYTGGTITYTIAAGNNAVLYVGQTVTVTQGGATQSYIVTAATPPTKAATGSFSAANTSEPNLNGTITASGQPLGQANPSIVNIAVLGNCPSSGNFYTGSTAVNYVYMNEVSTTAAALALGGFGTGPFNIGIPSTGSGDSAAGAALALSGVQNAANNANQLYDITGSSSTNVNTYGYQGEAHIARTNTPAGNGVVPQALVNTLGNILASCVDSLSTGSYSNGTITGAYSTPCATLFQNATSDGINASSLTASNVPHDIATAAFNIAHFPAGPAGTSSTTNTAGQSGYFMNQLYGLQGTTSPFQPALTTQPNDFTAAISYTKALNPALGTTESIGIDDGGNIWVNSAGTQDNLVKLNSLGVIQVTTPTAAYSYGYLSVDPSDNVWTGATFATEGETKFSSTGAVLSGTGGFKGPGSAGAPISGFTGTGFYDPYITVTDSTGTAYVAATPPTGANYNSQWFMLELQPTGANVANSPFSLTGGMKAGYQAAHGAVDNLQDGGDIWWTTESAGTNNPSYSISRFSAGGTLASGFPITNNGTFSTGSTNTSVLAPEMPAIDASSNMWVANQNGGSGGSIIKVSKAGVVSNVTGGGVVSGPFGVAIDGVGNVWVANRSTGSTANVSILEYSPAGTAISPSRNYTLGSGGAGTGGDTLNQPLNLAVDPSGAVWITSYAKGGLMELLGPGSPTYTPLSAASGVNKLGSRP
jgi:hypothetical protein